MKKNLLLTVMSLCVLLGAFAAENASTGNSSRGAAGAGVSLNRIALNMLSNSSSYDVASEVNRYENTLRLGQPESDGKLTAEMLYQGDNLIYLYRYDPTSSQDLCFALVDLRVKEPPTLSANDVVIHAPASQGIIVVNGSNLEEDLNVSIEGENFNVTGAPLRLRAADVNAGVAGILVNFTGDRSVSANAVVTISSGDASMRVNVTYDASTYSGDLLTSWSAAVNGTSLPASWRGGFSSSLNPDGSAYLSPSKYVKVLASLLNGNTSAVVLIKAAMENSIYSPYSGSITVNDETKTFYNVSPAYQEFVWNVADASKGITITASNVYVSFQSIEVYPPTTTTAAFTAGAPRRLDDGEIYIKPMVWTLASDGWYWPTQVNTDFNHFYATTDTLDLYGVVNSLTDAFTASTSDNNQADFYNYYVEFSGNGASFVPSLDAVDAVILDANKSAKATIAGRNLSEDVTVSVTSGFAVSASGRSAGTSITLTADEVNAGTTVTVVNTGDASAEGTLTVHSSQVADDITAIISSDPAKAIVEITRIQSSDYQTGPLNLYGSLTNAMPQNWSYTNNGAMKSGNLYIQYGSSLIYTVPEGYEKDQFTIDITNASGNYAVGTFTVSVNDGSTYSQTQSFDADNETKTWTLSSVNTGDKIVFTGTHGSSPMSPDFVSLVISGPSAQLSAEDLPVTFTCEEVTIPVFKAPDLNVYAPYTQAQVDADNDGSLPVITNATVKFEVEPNEGIDHYKLYRSSDATAGNASQWTDEEHCVATIAGDADGVITVVDTTPTGTVPSSTHYVAVAYANEEATQSEGNTYGTSVKTSPLGSVETSVSYSIGRDYEGEDGRMYTYMTAATNILGTPPDLLVDGYHYECYRYRVWCKTPSLGMLLLNDETTDATSLLLGQENFDLDPATGVYVADENTFSIVAGDTFTFVTRLYYRRVDDTGKRRSPNANLGDTDDTANLYYYVTETDASGVFTGVCEMPEDCKTVVSTTYTNVQGMKSNTPFEGVNIVEVRYTDGTSSVSKIMK